MTRLRSLSKVGGDQHIGGTRGQKVEGDRSPMDNCVLYPANEWRQSTDRLADWMKAHIVDAGCWFRASSAAAAQISQVDYFDNCSNNDRPAILRRTRTIDTRRRGAVSFHARPHYNDRTDGTPGRVRNTLADYIAAFQLAY